MVAETDQARLKAEVHMHRLWSGEGGIVEMVVSGKRDPTEVARILQAIKDGKKFVKASGASDSVVDSRSQLASWQTFYHEVWGIKRDFSDLNLPASRDGFNWLIVMLKGLTLEKIVAKMRDHMKVYVWDERWLKKVTSARQTNQDYAVWVRDRVEADEELKNLSANDLKTNGTVCITLEERLMLEFFYYWKNKKHLDVKNITLCAGSRFSSGSVPGVRWYGEDGWVCVYWRYADYRDGRLRGRVAVS